MKVFSGEVKVIDWMIKHRIVIFIALITLLYLIAYRAGLNFVSGDAYLCLLPWYDEIESRGFEALASQVGDYNLVYQFLIWVGTLLPISPLAWYKGTTLVFTLLLGIAGALLVRDLTKNDTLSILSYAIILFIPEVLINGGVWAQCDAIYTAFVILAIRELFRHSHGTPFLFLGLALSFKLQACFIFPFFVFAYLIRREFSALNLIWFLVGFYVPCLPCFIAGRSILAPIGIYFSQTGSYPHMFMNFPSFWCFVGDSYDTLKSIAIMVTFAVLLCGFFLMISRQNMKSTSWLDGKNALLLATWTAWTCVEFLPAMHERYDFMVTILLTITIICLHDKRLVPAWIGIVICNCATYGNALFGLECPLLPLAAVMLCAWSLCSWVFFDRLIRKGGRRRPHGDPMVSRLLTSEDAIGPSRLAQACSHRTHRRHP